MMQESNLTNLPCTAAEFGDLSADLLKMGKQVRFRARGYSMTPLVRDMDVLLVQPVRTSLIRIGDIILCSIQPDRVVVHRVIRRRSDLHGFYFMVQGDRAAQPDGWIQQSQVLGRVAEVERGELHLDMNSPAARGIALFAVLSSRRPTGRGWFTRIAGGWIKRLPVFSKYLN